MTCPRVFHYCPHLNSSLMDGINVDEYWLAHGLEMLRRSDVAFGYFPKTSAGARGELAEAARLDMPVVQVSEQAWIQGGEEWSRHGWR